jgi:hypothetical protein
MLYWIYVLIAGLVLALVLRELVQERQWRSQLALAIIVIPLLLRILQVK